MSQTSHTPSGRIAARMCRIVPAGSVMSCRQSKVVTSAKRASAGSGSRRASWNVTFGAPAARRFSSARASACSETSQPWNAERGKTFAISRTATPAPQPTSATWPPRPRPSPSPATSRRALLAEPLPDPALGAPGARRQLRARQRLPVGQRPVEAEPVPQVDHGGGHRPAERAEDELRVGLELLEVHLAGHRALLLSDPTAIVAAGPLLFAAAP